jgi:hypothetical protein
MYLGMKYVRSFVKLDYSHHGCNLNHNPKQNKTKAKFLGPIEDYYVNGHDYKDIFNFFYQQISMVPGSS